MKKKVIIGIKVPSRSVNVPEVQRILSTYGSIIKTRLGLHEMVESPDTPYGIVLLELYGDRHEIAHFESDLLTLVDLEIQKMYFTI